MLDALRERAIALRAAGSQQKVGVQEQPPDYGKKTGNVFRRPLSAFQYFSVSAFQTMPSLTSDL